MLILLHASDGAGIVGPDRSPQPPQPPKPAEPARDAGVGTLGVALFLASLGSFFAAGLAAVVVLSLTSANWPGAGSVTLPNGLWLSTAVILASSLALEVACRAAGRTDARRVQVAMVVALLLAIAFVKLQVLNWLALADTGQYLTSNLFLWLFYVLTALHAAHVIGGLIPVTIATTRALHGRHTRAGLRHCAMYWHFLGVVWLAMLGVMHATN